MTIARFYSRISDALLPVLELGSSPELRDELAKTKVLLRGPESIIDHPVHQMGFRLATNLCARLYPSIALAVPRPFVDDCCALIREINPDCEVRVLPPDAKEDLPSLVWGEGPGSDRSVVVEPYGWEVAIDKDSSSPIGPTNALCSLASAAVGVGELFRTVFAKRLKAGRQRPTPARFNLVTHEADGDVPVLPDSIDFLDEVVLVGAGAIGQAFVHALSCIDVSGRLTVVDPETIELSNLQRYVLTNDSDVGKAKCELVARALEPGRLAVNPVRAEWGVGVGNVGRADTVIAAVDSSSVRIAIQASLPRRIYNAWTQPGDLGWSRHERFGAEPCLGCLYWPVGSKPHQHQQISLAVRQHELRVLAYLTLRIPVDLPLKDEQIPRLPQYGRPADSGRWTTTPILEDIAKSLGVETTELRRWKGRRLDDLYGDGICGGAIVAGSSAAAVPRELVVPMAHQSVLAGVMLATDLVVACVPELSAVRGNHIEGRIDVLTGFPQHIARPRSRTVGCLCADEDFLLRYRQKWGQQTACQTPVGAP